MDPFGPVGGDDGPTEQPEDVCLGDAHPDDLSLDLDGASPIDGPARRVVELADRFVVCGDGFVRGWDPQSGSSTSDTDIGGPCNGLAAAGDDRIVVTTASELLVMHVGADGVHELGSTAVSGTVGGVASDGASAWVATGVQGVAVYDVAGDSPASSGTWASSDARDVAYTDAGIVVAAGANGIELWSTTGASMDTMATDSPALGVRAGDGRVAVLRGAFGWDLVDVDSGLAKVATLDTGGVVLDAAVSSAEVITAEAYALVRYEVGSSAEVASVQLREGLGDLDAPWIRGVAQGDSGAAVVTDTSIVPLSIEPMAHGPRVEVDVPSLSLWSRDEDHVEGLYVIRNAGDTELHLRGVSVEGPIHAEVDDANLEESDQCPDQLVVEPDGSLLITVGYEATGQPFTATLRIETDDPDAPALEIPVDGDRAAPAVGDDVPDFAVPTLDGGTFRLSDHAGKVVFIKLFNFACSTCAEEFPLVEQDLLPDYASTDVLMVGLNVGHRTGYAADLAAESGLTFPVGLDLDSEVFRHLRIPGGVFPLHAVIGRDGRLAWVSNEKGIEPVRAAIEAAL